MTICGRLCRTAKKQGPQISIMNRLSHIWDRRFFLVSTDRYSQFHIRKRIVQNLFTPCPFYGSQLKIQDDREVCNIRAVACKITYRPVERLSTMKVRVCKIEQNDSELHTGKNTEIGSIGKEYVICREFCLNYIHLEYVICKQKWRILHTLNALAGLWWGAKYVIPKW